MRPRYKIPDGDFQLQLSDSKDTLELYFKNNDNTDKSLLVSQYSFLTKIKDKIGFGFGLINSVLVGVGILLPVSSTVSLTTGSEMLLISKSSTSSSSYTDALIMYFFLFLTTLVFVAHAVKGQVSSSIEDLSENGHNGAAASTWYTIEGRVLPPLTPERKPGLHHQSSGNGNNDWTTQLQIVVNGGENIGHVKEDGSFVIHGVSSGSHVIDVVHPSIHYESARVDITSKGKIRARKVNNLQPSLVTHVVYPLRLTPLGPYRYFQQREQWRVTDVLLSPMVLMMVLPLILIVILPKMMNDPETKKEMESMQLPKYEMPEVSEMLTSFFGGGGASPNHHKEDNGDRRKAIRGKKAN